MKFLKTDSYYIIRLFKGEEIIQTITAFCEKEGISAGVLHGIGSVQNAQLGYYILSDKKYIFKEISEDHEVVSLTGNVALVDEKPFLHIHTVLSNNKFECFGGHLKTGIVGATCEIYLSNAGAEIKRELDESIGLKLLNCPEEF